MLHGEILFVAQQFDLEHRLRRAMQKNINISSGETGLKRHPFYSEKTIILKADNTGSVSWLDDATTYDVPLK